MVRSFGFPFLVFGILGFHGVTAQTAVGIPTSVRVSWETNQIDRQLAEVKVGELRELKVKSQIQLDPNTGKPASWTGVLMSEFLDRVMKPLSIEDRAQVDLLLVRSAFGQEVALPRSFVNKYPVMLAFERDGETLKARGPVTSVVPWTTHNKTIYGEYLPLESYFLGNVVRIVLTSFKRQYGNKFFVKRRTDPFVLRGEKRFFQSCMGCHYNNSLPSIPELALSVSRNQNLQFVHSNLKNTPRLSETDRRAMTNYFAEILESYGPVDQRGLASQK